MNAILLRKDNKMACGLINGVSAGHKVAVLVNGLSLDVVKFITY